MKRFIDTELMLRPWFRGLEPRLKCLWLWMLTRCDMAGVIDMDWELASFAIGQTVADADLSAMNGNVVIIGSGKLFIPAFICFQYGELREASPVHRGVLKVLDSHGIAYPLENEELHTLSIGLQKPIDRAKDKDKAKAMTKNKAKAIASPGCFVPPTVEEVAAYCHDRGNKIDAERWWDHYQSNGWMVGKTKMKDWKAAVRTWEKNDSGQMFGRKDWNAGGGGLVL